MSEEFIEDQPNPPPEAGPEPEEEREEATTSQRPALTINIQSWATPIVGLVMLAAGLLLGYFGRPLLTSDPTPVAQATQAVAPSQGDQAPNPTVNPNLPQTREELMSFLMQETKHFLGDPNAEVTIIEFSDFQ
jgi:hypothetical protein